MPVQLDCGAVYQGYLGDLSRLVFLGNPAGKLRDLMAVAAEMYDRCLKLVRRLKGIAATVAGQRGEEITASEGDPVRARRVPGSVGVLWQPFAATQRQLRGEHVAGSSEQHDHAGNAGREHAPAGDSELGCHPATANKVRVRFGVSGLSVWNVISNRCGPPIPWCITNG